MIFVVVTMTAVCGLCSMAADYARVQLAKTELRRAADAVSRAAVAALSSGVTAAQDAAVTYGAYNAVDGTALAIDPTKDVEFGTWDNTAKTFTPLSGAARANAKAVRVTARRTAASGNPIPLFFARVVGKTSCDVTAQSVALYTPTAGTGFVGLDGVDVGNNSLVRSYNANAGTPGGANLTSSAKVSSNGPVTAGNNTDVYGDIATGPAGSVTGGSHFYVSGSQLTRGSNLAYVATEAPTVAGGGNLSLGNGQTLTLPGGTYNYAAVTVGNGVTINATGAVTIYLTGNLNAGNSLTINAYQNKPTNFKLRLVGTGHTFSAGNGLDLTAELYAPGWDFRMLNNGQVAGSIVARSIDAGTNGELFYDTSLGSTASSGAVSTVK
jgi:hypothetical protein